MITIGEFAGFTGITVKALRHYDDVGVLPPADVDPRTGYRRYTASQVRDGALVAALREAGVPLPAVKAALTNRDPEAVLETHRAQVLADRAAEDAAHAATAAALRAYARPVRVEARSLPATPYVARLVVLRADDDLEHSDAQANAEFATLFRALQADGIGPAGGCWTAIRPDSGPDTVALVLAWPTSRRAPDGWGGDGVVADELPARTELVASWHGTDDDALPAGSVHPAVVALFEALAARGVATEPSEVRQTVLQEPDGRYTVDVAVTLEPRSAA